MLNDYPEMPAFLVRQQEEPRAPMLTLTYTIINTYDICPHQMYRRYIKKDLKFVETPEMKWGNEVHSAFEYRMGGKPLPGAKYDKAGKLVTPSMQHWEPIAATIAERKPQIEQQLAVDAKGKPTDYWGKGSAQPFFRGKNDLTLINGTRALLFDIKTGKKREDPTELETNAMLVKAHNPGLTEIKASYIWLKDNAMGQMHDVSDVRSTWARINNKAEQIADNMASGEWPKKKGPLCGYCNVMDCENRFDAKTG